MVILAFPGMGKTPLAKQQGKYIDLDFGNFREAMGFSKAEEHKLHEPFIKLIRLYESQGYVVLSNDPGLMSVADIVYLPANPKFSARKLKVSETQVMDWINDWVERAERNHVRVRMIKVGLDHYLGKTQKGADKHAKKTAITR